LKAGAALRTVLVNALIVVAVSSCREDGKAPAAKARKGGAPAVKSQSLRARQAMDEIMEVLARHSVMTPVKVESRFSPSGEVLSCSVELGGPSKASPEALRREVCAVVATLGKPEPPPSLSFTAAFRAPLVVPSEDGP
jgi:hypothetical protein